MNVKKRLILTAAGGVATLATALGTALPASAATQDGSSLKTAQKCFFDGTHYTWVQVILGSYHNAGQPNGYYHRIIANYMGTYTFDANLNRRNNAESITDWKVLQQNASGSVNFGVGNHYTFAPPALGAYDETTSTSEYNYVHGSGLYVWEWLRRDDGATCVVKYPVT